MAFSEETPFNHDVLRYTSVTQFAEWIREVVRQAVAEELAHHRNGQQRNRIG